MSIGMSRSLADDNKTSSNDEALVRIVGSDGTTMADVITDTDNYKKLIIKSQAFTIPASVSAYYTDRAKDGSSNTDMTVDGSSTAVNYSINCEASDGMDIYITDLRFVGVSNSIVINNFLSIAPLTNGIEISFRSNSTTYTFPYTIKTTADFIKTFSGAETIDTGSSPDYFFATMTLAQPIRLYKGTTDKINVKVQDDLSAVSLVSLELSCWGYKI